jgi:prepilin-type processing-associated H-X9-DG protein/prepilin-type N-terminal cleavage/methylation domain-containing protein
MPVLSGRTRRRAFTLTELIVVITVLAILALILIPVVAKVRSSAQSTHCMSNLQQIGRAFTLYAQDHRSMLPAPADPVADTSWFEAIHSYTGDRPLDKGRPLDGQLNTVFTCPTLALADHTPTRAYIGYSMSAGMSAPTAPEPRRPVSLPSLQFPTRTVVLIESVAGEASPMPFFPTSGTLETFGSTYTNAFEAQGCDRHSGAANYLFADGHVGHHTPQEAAVFLK